MKERRIVPSDKKAEFFQLNEDEELSNFRGKMREKKKTVLVVFEGRATIRFLSRETSTGRCAKKKWSTVLS